MVNTLLVLYLITWMPAATDNCAHQLVRLSNAGTQQADASNPMPVPPTDPSPGPTDPTPKPSEPIPGPQSPTPKPLHPLPSPGSALRS